jgi:hypothetical protein
MKIYILVILLALNSTNCLASDAEDNPELHAKMIASQLEYLKSHNLPLPDDGVTLVTREELNAPAWAVKKQQADLIQKNKLGYVKEDAPRATELLNYKNKAPEESKRFIGVIKPWNTMLRREPQDLKMAYTFVGVPKDQITHEIGVAPVGKYDDEGWSGAVQIFDTSFGSCAFTEKNLRITHGSSRILKDIVTYEINGKVTLTDIKGTDASGYLYKILWIDQTFDRTLECATQKFNLKTMDRVIELAKTIDVS